MSDNRIFDDKYRENFIKTADILTLNEYLKNMQRLSRKGGIYLEMYNKDISYMLDINDSEFQDAGNTSSVLSKPSTDIVTEQPANTEVYLDRFNNITQRVVANTTQRVINTNKPIISKKSELENLKDILLDNKQSYNHKKKAVTDFIDNLFDQNAVFLKEYDAIKIQNTLDISNIIAKNIDLMKDAFLYLTKILQNNRNKVSEEFMKDYIELRNKKLLNIKDYQIIKNKLITDYTNKIGSEKLYTSKFVEKIINAYKKAKVAGL